jgi:hypothetical protein
MSPTGTITLAIRSALVARLHWRRCGRPGPAVAAASHADSPLSPSAARRDPRSATGRIRLTASPDTFSLVNAYLDGALAVPVALRSRHVGTAGSASGGFCSAGSGSPWRRVVLTGRQRGGHRSAWSRLRPWRAVAEGSACSRALCGVVVVLSEIDRPGLAVGWAGAASRAL